MYATWLITNRIEKVINKTSYYFLHFTTFSTSPRQPPTQLPFLQNKVFSVSYMKFQQQQQQKTQPK